jgi:hypothetical protein
MFSYFAFGMIVRSELQFPEFVLCGDGHTDATIREGNVQIPIHTATPIEEFVFNEAAGAFHIVSGRQITFQRALGATDEAVRLLLLGRVMAILLRQRGWLPLHASGVRIGNATVLFLGRSGAGKSTTAAAFYLAGHQVITDDIGAVRLIDGRCIVQPGWPRVRLLEDSREMLTSATNLSSVLQADKYTCSLEGPVPWERMPLSRIYLLDLNNRISTERLSPMIGAALLSQHSFVKRRRSTVEVMRAHLARCTEIAAIVPVFRLARPSALTSLPLLVQAVERELL